MINKLRTKPRDKAVYKDTVRSIPAFIVCLALSVYSLIAYFSFADFPLYSVIAFPVITAVVVLFAVLGIVRGRKKAFRFSTAGKDDRYPTVMIMQVMPADNKTPFPTAYLEYYPCGAEPVKQYAELEAALNDLIDQVSDSEAEKLYEQEEQLSDALGDCIDYQDFAPVDVLSLYRKKIVLDKRIYDAFKPYFDWNTVRLNQNEIILFEKLQNK